MLSVSFKHWKKYLTQTPNPSSVIAFVPYQSAWTNSITYSLNFIPQLFVDIIFFPHKKTYHQVWMIISKRTVKLQRGDYVQLSISSVGLDMFSFLREISFISASELQSRLNKHKYRNKNWMSLIIPKWIALILMAPSTPGNSPCGFLLSKIQITFILGKELQI